MKSLVLCAICLLIGIIFPAIAGVVVPFLIVDHMIRNKTN